MKTVDQLMFEAFNCARDPRSPEYKAGVRTILACRIDGAKYSCPYELGTASADAFFAGTDEGHRILSELRDRPQEAA